MKSYIIILIITILINCVNTFGYFTNQRNITNEVNNIKGEPYLFVYKFNGFGINIKEVETLIIAIKPNGEVMDKQNNKFFKKKVLFFITLEIM